MADFYISPSGSNGNTGTELSPWRDLSYAVANYNDNSGRFSEPGKA